jgi:hypothetical protein
VALRDLGLGLREFRRLTPAEFELRLEGYRQRWEEWRYLVAWAVHHLMQIHIKKRIHFHELLAELWPEERVGELLRAQMTRRQAGEPKEPPQVRDGSRRKRKRRTPRRGARR